jgi:putative phage-type endonuclease
MHDGGKEDTVMHDDYSSQRASGVNPIFQRVVHSEQRDAWLEARSLALGASESSTIMGLNPYESQFTLFQRRKGRVPPVADNEPMEWGRRLEEVIAEKFADATGRKVMVGRSQLCDPADPLGGWMLQSLAYPWLSATPDRDQRDPAWDEDGILEIKTASAYALEEWRDEPPLHYQCQLQHQLLVTGRRHGTLAALIGGQTFLWKDIPRHERFIASLVRTTRIFWKRLQTDDAPVPDDSPSTSATLLAMLEKGEAIQLPDIVLDWHLAALQAVEDEKAAKERKEEYRRKILAVMGTAAYGVLPGSPFGSNGVYKCVTERRPAHLVPEQSLRVLRYKKRLAL